MNTAPLMVLLFSLIICFSSGCSSLQSQWESTKSQNTIEAYQEFLEKHPDGQFSEEAKRQLESLRQALDLQRQQAELRRFEDATTKDQIAIYERFLVDYPASRYFTQIENAMENKISLLRNSNTRKIKIAHKLASYSDSVVVLALKRALQESGYTLAADTDSSYDAVLFTSELWKGTPAGRQVVKFSPDFKKAVYYVVAYHLKLGLKHRDFGLVLDKHVWGNQFFDTDIPSEYSQIGVLEMPQPKWINVVQEKDIIRTNLDSLCNNLESKTIEYLRFYLAVKR